MGMVFQAYSLFPHMTARENVALVIEGYNSPVTLAIQPVLARAGIMDITVLSKADGILASTSNPQAVRVNSSNAMDSAAIAGWLMNTVKAHKIGFATQNDAYGNGAQAGVEAELKKANWEYQIVSQQGFPFTATDFRVAVTALLLLCSAAIFIALFIGLATIQFWTQEAAEVASAFTYGGNALTQYPLVVYPREVVKALTYGIPLAFVSWYPALHVLGRPDPFGTPSWFAYAPPVAAAVVGLAATLAWRAGVRHYRSTGS